MSTNRPDDRADEQVERAAKVALDAMEAKQRADKEAVRASLGDLAVDLDGRDHDYRVEAWEVARALAAAGLLATPADQDSAAEVDWQAIAYQAEQDMADWVRNCGDAERRAEAAEAKVRAVQALADAHTGTHDLHCRCNDWAVISPNEIRSALGEGGAS